MLTTRFTELVGCTVPIQQAGMGAVSPPELVAAVSNAGGLGMLGTARSGGGTVRALGTLLDEVDALTDRPYGVNFLVNRESSRRSTPTASSWRHAARGSSNSSGVGPTRAGGNRPRARRAGQLASRVHGGGGRRCCGGADLIVAQGTAAGRPRARHHRRPGPAGRGARAVDVPVLAAGGIGSGRALAAVLAAGADGARMGTRFVAAAESDAHPDYVAALIAAGPADTVSAAPSSTAGMPRAGYCAPRPTRPRRSRVTSSVRCRAWTGRGCRCPALRQR